MERQPLFRSPRTPGRKVIIVALSIAAALLVVYSLGPLYLLILWGPEYGETTAVLWTRFGLCFGGGLALILAAALVSR